jgi:hypothetical protein
MTCEQRTIAALMGARSSAGLAGAGVGAAFVQAVFVLALETLAVVAEAAEGALCDPEHPRMVATKRRPAQRRGFFKASTAIVESSGVSVK